MTRSSDFARRISARWHGRRSSARPLTLALLRLHLGGAAARAASRTTLTTIAPRLSLTVVRPERVSVTVREGERSTQTLRDASTATVLRLRALERSDRLVERVFSRATRVESSLLPARPAAVSPLAAAPRAAAAPPLAPAGPGKLVVRQQGQPPPAQTRATIEPARGPATIVSAVAAPSEVDVGRLTDRVVAAIDQRLLAHAERLGRD